MFVLPPFILICSLFRLFIVFGCIAAHAHASETVITLVVRARAEAESAKQSIVAQHCQAACQKNNLSSTGGTKEIQLVGVFRLNEAMKNGTVGGRNAYSPKSYEALSLSATSRAHLGNSIPGEILDVRRVFIPRGTNDLCRDAGRIPEAYYLKELFLFRDIIYINSLVCA